MKTFTVDLFFGSHKILYLPVLKNFSEPSPPQKIVCLVLHFVKMLQVVVLKTKTLITTTPKIKLLPYDVYVWCMPHVGNHFYNEYRRIIENSHLVHAILA